MYVQIFSVYKLKLYIIIFSALLCVKPNLLMAQTVHADDITRAEFAPSVPKNGGLLWEISGNGLKQRSYILGTFHGITSYFTMEKILKIPGLQRILDSIEVIGMEADIEKIRKYKQNDIRRNSDQSLLAIGTLNIKTSKITQMPPNKYYSSLFNNYDEWKAFDARMRNQNIFSTLGQKPAYWLIFLKHNSKYMYMLMNHIVTEQRNVYNRPSVAVDDLILQHSNKNHIPRFYLDTWRDSLQNDNKHVAEYTLTAKDSIMLSKPLKVQMNALLAYLDTLESKTYIDGRVKELQKIQAINDSIIKTDKVLSDSLLDSYMAMDLDKIELVDSLYWKNFGSSGHIVPVGIKSGTIIRNEWWIPIIKENISRNACLIAFGCRHLPGRDGIIDRLRREGYSVTPVYN